MPLPRLSPCRSCQGTSILTSEPHVYYVSPRMYVNVCVYVCICTVCTIKARKEKGRGENPYLKHAILCTTHPHEPVVHACYTVLYVSLPLAIFSTLDPPEAAAAAGSPSRAGVLGPGLAPLLPPLPLPSHPILPFPGRARTKHVSRPARFGDEALGEGAERESVCVMVLQRNGKGGRDGGGGRTEMDKAVNVVGQRRPEGHCHLLACLIAHLLIDSGGLLPFFSFGTPLLSSSSLPLPRIEQDEGQRGRGCSAQGPHGAVGSTRTLGQSGSGRGKDKFVRRRRGEFYR